MADRPTQVLRAHMHSLLRYSITSANCTEHHHGWGTGWCRGDSDEQHGQGHCPRGARRKSPASQHHKPRLGFDASVGDVDPSEDGTPWPLSSRQLLCLSFNPISLREKRLHTQTHSNDPAALALLPSLGPRTKGHRCCLSGDLTCAHCSPSKHCKPPTPSPVLPLPGLQPPA